MMMFDGTDYDASDSDMDVGSTEGDDVTFDDLVRKNTSTWNWDDTRLMPDWDRKFYSSLDQVVDPASHPVHGCGWKAGLDHIWYIILDYLCVRDRYYLCMAFPNIQYVDKKNMRMQFQEFELNNKYVCHYCFIRCQYESQLQVHVESKHRIIVQNGGKRKLVETPRSRVIDYFPEFYLPTLMYNHKVYACPLCCEDAVCSNGLMIHMIYLHFEFFCLHCEIEIRGMCSYKSHCEMFHKEMSANNNCQSCFDEMVHRSSYELYRHCVMDHWRRQEVIQFFGWETEELLVDVMQTIRDLCVYGYSQLRIRMDKNLKICQWLRKTKNWKPRHVNICRKNATEQKFTLDFPSSFTREDELKECESDCDCDIFIGNEVIPSTICSYQEWVRFKENVEHLL